MKRVIGIILVLAAFFGEVKSQGEITLEECYQWVAENTPLIHQKQLYQSAFSNQNEILDKSMMPKVAWNTKAQFQSDALSLTFPFPGQEPIELPYYNIQSTIDAGYLILDGGLLEAKKNIETANLAANLQSVEVAVYQLKEMVNQYYWGIILVETQRGILESGVESITARINTMESLVEQGVVLPGTVKKLKAEKLKIANKIAAINGQNEALRALLSQFTGKEEVLGAKLKRPQIMKDVFAQSNHRPELKLFDLQTQKVLANQALSDVAYRPKLQAFLKAGLGYPSPINLFKTEISPYAIGGLQFSWNIFDWGQRDRQKQQLQIQSEIVQKQKENFEFNIQNIKGKYQAEITALQEQITLDEKLVVLQDEILSEYAAQLEQGVITPTDYLIQLNEGLQARLNKEVHLLKIEQLKTEYLTKLGVN